MAAKLTAVNRRRFFKIAGVTALGLAGKPALPLLAQGPRWAPRPPGAQALTAKRWAMVVDIRACRHEDGCQDCIDACHRAHNVPDFGNPKDEVKWIWKEHYGEAFPNQGPQRGMKRPTQTGAIHGPRLSGPPDRSSRRPNAPISPPGEPKSETPG